MHKKITRMTSLFYIREKTRYSSFHVFFLLKVHRRNACDFMIFFLPFTVQERKHDILLSILFFLKIIKWSRGTHKKVVCEDCKRKTSTHFVVLLIIGMVPHMWKSSPHPTVIFIFRRVRLLSPLRNDSLFGFIRFVKNKSHEENGVSDFYTLFHKNPK